MSNLNYNWKKDWNRIVKSVDITTKHSKLEQIGKKFELLENLLDQCGSLITNIRGSSKDIFTTKQSQNRFHKILYHIFIVEKVISNQFYPYIDNKLKKGKIFNV